MNIEKTIKDALEKLGVTGKVSLNYQAFTVQVIVDGKYFGLWDIPKSTFVE